MRDSAELALRDRVLFSILAAYVLLDYGFAVVRVPPVVGGGVPIGEICLLFYLAAIRAGSVLRQLAVVVPVLPLTAFWTFGLFSAAIGFVRHGGWALRDATSVIESLYLLVGFAVAGRAAARGRLLFWTKGVLACGIVMLTLYPFRGFLQLMTPISVTAGSGQPVSLFWNFGLVSNLAIISAAYLFLGIGRASPRPLDTVVAVTLLAFATVLLQSRSVYLEIACMLAILQLCGKRVGRMLLALALAIGLVVLLLSDAWGSSVTRLGQPVSLRYLIEHALSIGGYSTQQTLASAQGIGLRLGWWSHLADQLTSSVPNLFGGLGYGTPLVDFFDLSGNTVREPHNSYISVVSRLGLTGLICWLWFHAGMLSSALTGLRETRRRGWLEHEKWIVLGLVAVSTVLMAAIGEDALEKPYLAIPYYFTWGVLLRCCWFIRMGDAESSAKEPDRESEGTLDLEGALANRGS